jgi:intracellular multiplication protein IcmE
MDPGLRRNLLIIGGVLGVAALGLVIMVGFRASAPSPSAQAPTGVAVPGAAAGGQARIDAPSPVMQQLLREQHLAEADAARRAGRPYIPPDSAGSEPIPAATPQSDSRLGVPGAANGAYGSSAGSGSAAGASPEEQAKRERLRRGIENQMKDLVAAAAPPSNVARIQVASAESAGSPAPGVGPAQGRPAQAAANTAPVRVAAPVADALEIFPAVTMTPVDTYKTGYFSARIAGGRLAGAFLVGRTQMVNEGLQPRFTQMRWNGKTYSIDAIALDETSGTDAVDAQLDRRYMQRYVMPIIVAMVGGYTAAKAQTGTAVVGVGVDGGAGTAVAQPPPTEKQAVNAGIAQGMAMTQRAVEQEASLPIRASLPAGAPIGVMFNAPVADVDSSREANQEAARAANSARVESMPPAPAARTSMPQLQAAQPQAAYPPTAPAPTGVPGFGGVPSSQAMPYGRATIQ